MININNLKYNDMTYDDMNSKFMSNLHILFHGHLSAVPLRAFTVHLAINVQILK